MHAWVCTQPQGYGKCCRPAPATHLCAAPSLQCHVPRCEGRPRTCAGHEMMWGLLLPPPPRPPCAAPRAPPPRQLPLLPLQPWTCGRRGRGRGCASWRWCPRRRRHPHGGQCCQSARTVSSRQRTGVMGQDRPWRPVHTDRSCLWGCLALGCDGKLRQTGRHRRVLVQSRHATQQGAGRRCMSSRTSGEPQVGLWGPVASAANATHDGFLGSLSG